VVVATDKEHEVLIAQRPTLTEEVVDEHRSRFMIEPLEPGFGYTLGNSLRRTLLSSIPGAAVTSIKVDGVLHEFSTVAGVKEDATQLILNLKDLDRVVREAVIVEVDHRHLKQVPFLEGVIPTAENLAVAFWGRLRPHLPDGSLQSVRVYETEKNWAECSDAE